MPVSSSKSEMMLSSSPSGSSVPHHWANSMVVGPSSPLSPEEQAAATRLNAAHRETVDITRDFLNMVATSPSFDVSAGMGWKVLHWCPFPPLRYFVVPRAAVA